MDVIVPTFDFTEDRRADAPPRDPGPDGMAAEVRDGAIYFRYYRDGMCWCRSYTLDCLQPGFVTRFDAPKRD